jgi:energy-coupling factor transporter transmembrane protein EcfT
MILIMTILVTTTKNNEMSNALENLLSPLRIFKAPINE